MCTINSHKIIIASQCSQQTTVKISYHLDMYNIICKNDKLARSILVKIVNPIKSIKQQILYFSQLHPSAIILYKNLHGNMLFIFIPIIFLRKHHLLIDKQKDPIINQVYCKFVIFSSQSMSTKVLQNWNHNFITFLAQVAHFTRLQTFKKYLSSYILFTFKYKRNITFHIFIKTTLQE